MKALRHLFRCQFLLCCGYILLSGYALAATQVGQVAVLVGEATAVSAEGTERKLKNKAPVYLNDAIRTQTDGQLQLFFNDKSIVTIGSDSELIIDNYVFDPKNSKGTFFTKSARGVFRMVTGWISANHPDKVKLTTPLGTIGIRGCYLAGAIDEKKKTLRLLYLGGLRGAERGVYVTNEFGVTLLSRAGFGLEITTFGMAPSSPMRFNTQRTRNLLAPTDIRSVGGKGIQPAPGSAPKFGEKPVAKPGERPPPKPGVAPGGSPIFQSDKPGWDPKAGGQPGEPGQQPKPGSKPAGPPPLPRPPSSPPSLPPPKHKPSVPRPPIRPEPPKPKPPQNQAAQAPQVQTPQTAQPQAPQQRQPQAPQSPQPLPPPLTPPR